MKKETLRKKHFDRVSALWDRVCLGYTVRSRWCRRRGIPTHSDIICLSLYNQCRKYYDLLTYIKDEDVHSYVIRPFNSFINQRSTKCH